MFTISETVRGFEKLAEAWAKVDKLDPEGTTLLERIASKPAWCPMWLWDIEAHRLRQNACKGLLGVRAELKTK